MTLQPERSEKGNNSLDAMCDEGREGTGRKPPGVLQCQFPCSFLGFWSGSRLFVKRGSCSGRQHSDRQLAVQTPDFRVCLSAGT